MTEHGREARALELLRAIERKQRYSHVTPHAGGQSHEVEQNIFIDILTTALQAAQAATLVWTSEKPTEPGWYWWRLERGKPEMVVEVRDPSYLDDVLAAEWSSSPIPRPEE